MLLAYHGIIPPTEWLHKPNLINKTAVAIPVKVDIIKSLFSIIHFNQAGISPCTLLKSMLGAETPVLPPVELVLSCSIKNYICECDINMDGKYLQRTFSYFYEF